MSKQPPPAPTASAVGPFPTVIQIVGRPGTGSLPSTFAPPDHPQFNEKVSMDFKQWNGHWILHIIDVWSRYTVSIFINRKKPSDVIDALMQRWIAVFGTMGSIMKDNGGEFS